MGGSAVAGDLVAAIAESRGSLPIVAVRTPDPPAWIDGRAFVIASSYSGNTEETLDVEYTYYGLLALGHLSL